MGEYIDKLKVSAELVELAALERVKDYFRTVNGKKVRVSGHTRKGEGPGHRDAVNKLHRMEDRKVGEDLLSENEISRFRRSAARGEYKRKQAAADKLSVAGEHFRNANEQSAANEDVVRTRKHIEDQLRQGHLTSEHADALKKRLNVDNVDDVLEEIRKLKSAKKGNG